MRSGGGRQDGNAGTAGDEAALKPRMLHLLPETAVLQVGVVKERLRGARRPPGEAAFLGSVINLFCRQAGNEIGDEIVDYVRKSAAPARVSGPIWSGRNRCL
jgi:hypothetical protein